MRFSEPIHRARLLRRYKRFLADVEFEDGRILTVHCPNPGSMLGVSRPGSAAYVSRSSNPGRKLAWSLEAVRVGRHWVGVNPLRANAVVDEALEEDRIVPLRGFPVRRREVRIGERSRADFLLERSTGERLWLEVKQVTLVRGELALFPDARTERGLRHLRELQDRVRHGDSAVLLFLASRPDVSAVGPADGIDPDYGRALRRAREAGVQVLGYRLHVGRDGLRWGDRLQVDPGPHPYEKTDLARPPARSRLPRSRSTL